MAHESLGKISRLAFHPIKGARRVEAQQIRITPDGIEGDREYMIVRYLPREDGVHEFVTQRDKRNDTDESQSFAVLTQVEPNILEEGLELKWKGGDTLLLSRNRRGKEIPVRVWDDTVAAVDLGAAASEWLSDHLGTPLRLVRAAGSFKRRARQNYMENTNGVRFQDGYPVHWFLESSLRELSDRAGEDIPWQTFRPNMVVEGAPAQCEHRVARGTVGDVPFLGPKPCDRCAVTNVDQDTGLVTPGRVISELVKYKRWKKKEGGAAVIFGENMLPLREGKIQIGDEVVMTEERNPPLEYR